MDRWLKDREELIQHWDKLNIFWRIILLFFFRIVNIQTTESLIYILNRLYVRHDRMVKIYSVSIDDKMHTTKWDSIDSYLERNLWNR